MPSIDKETIAKELEQLQYPLYFLDYETFSYIIPFQHGLRPYQQMVFQFSLHIQDDPNSAIRHEEFLLSSRQQSVEELVIALQKAILGEQGSVLVWNDSFEKNRNLEMGEQFPAYQNFLLSVNDRMFDLMKIFKKGYYQHPQFKGKVFH